MNAIMQHLPEDPAALRTIVDLQLQTLVQRDARIASLCGMIAAIRSAANGDLSPETDTETLVRNLYHANEDLKQDNSKLRRQLMKNTAHPFTAHPIEP